MEAQPAEEKKFKLFGKKKEEAPKPIAKEPEELPKVAEEQTAQEVQINTILMHLQRCQESLELAQKEFINMLKNA